jgi:hypothetical protein
MDLTLSDEVRSQDAKVVIGRMLVNAIARPWPGSSCASAGTRSRRRPASSSATR